MVKKRKKIPKDKLGEIQKEILSYNYWEHIKFEKDLAFILEADHPRRLALRALANEMSAKLFELDKKEKELKL